MSHRQRVFTLPAALLRGTWLVVAFPYLPEVGFDEAALAPANVMGVTAMHRNGGGFPDGDSDDHSGNPGFQPQQGRERKEEGK